MFRAVSKSVKETGSAIILFCTCNWSQNLLLRSPSLDKDFFLVQTSQKDVSVYNNNNGVVRVFFQLNNPDMRVVILKDFVKKHFPTTTVMDYAIEVEKITTSKVT